MSSRRSGAVTIYEAMNALLLLRNKACLEIPPSFCTFKAFRSHKDQVCGRGAIPQCILHSIAFASRHCGFYKHEHGFAQGYRTTYYANKYLAAWFT